LIDTHLKLKVFFFIFNMYTIILLFNIEAVRLSPNVNKFTSNYRLKAFI